MLVSLPTWALLAPGVPSLALHQGFTSDLHQNFSPAAEAHHSSPPPFGEPVVEGLGVPGRGWLQTPATLTPQQRGQASEFLNGAAPVTSAHAIGCGGGMTSSAP